MRTVRTVAARTVAAAALAAALLSPPMPAHFACFKTDVHTVDSEGYATCIEGEYRHNLTTTTAVGYTNANDWLSKAMGQGCSFAFASAQGTLTGATATTATNSGATFPTAGQGLAGSIIVVGANSAGAGSTVYGRIASNTGTAITVDQWYSGTSTSGAAGTTPSTTGQYIILPGQAPAEWMAVTADATTPTTADTTLTAELTGSGMARAVGTYAHVAASNTYTLVHLWTATATVTINKEAQFGAATTTAGGVMPFESLEPSPPTLVSGDTLTNTVTITV